MTKTNIILAHVSLTALASCLIYDPSAPWQLSVTLLFTVGSLWSANFVLAMILFDRRP